tara:strand:+ start:639 stop:830 length:192 start_codon:yes stop_codon:yes gene_type:complete
MKSGDLIKFKPNWVPGGFADPCLGLVLKPCNNDGRGNSFIVLAFGMEQVVDLENYDIQIISTA